MTINLHSWFIEPTSTTPPQIRIWGKPTPKTPSTRWWRSSTIQKRRSKTSLQTNHGTLITLQGPIHTPIATRLMTPAATTIFHQGFPPLWKTFLLTAFPSTPALPSSPASPTPSSRVLRSTRLNTRSARSATLPGPASGRVVKLATSAKPAHPVTKKPPSTTPQTRKTRQTSTVAHATTKRVTRSTAIHASTPTTPKLPRQARNIPTSPHTQPPQTRATRHTRSTAAATTRTTKTTVAKTPIPTTPKPPRQSRNIPTRQTKRGAPAPSQQPATSNHPTKSTLATNLNQARQAKRVRRTRRVAFADQAVVSAPRTPRKTNHTSQLVAQPATPKKLPWSAEQRASFERMRNSVPADSDRYWELVAAGVDRKTADECRALWECSWGASPGVGGRKRRVEEGELATGEMVEELRRMGRTAQGRGTGKFRRRVRELADRVAGGVRDEEVEPVLEKGAEVGTPCLGVVGAVGDGTPGTEVRRRREVGERAGVVDTPEILKKGNGFGLREADLYVALFRRRVGKGAGEGGSKQGKGGNEGYESDESAPFF